MKNLLFFTFVLHSFNLLADTTIVALNRVHHSFGNSGNNRVIIDTLQFPQDINSYSEITMSVNLECPNGGCDPWDRFANILVKNSDTNQWYEMARHITPYGVGNSVLDRGLEVDVTDFKSLLIGNVELKTYAETWVSSGWVISLEFDFLAGEPDYKYYQITPVIQFNNNSLSGVPYGGENGVTELDETKFDLKKSISLGETMKFQKIFVTSS